MNDYEIDEIRRIRHEISEQYGHDLGQLAEHYRNLERELRESGRFKFSDDQAREEEPANSRGAI